MKIKVIKSLFALLLLFSCGGIVAAQAQEAEPLDLRILVDISGQVKASQPEQLHLDALHLLVEQLPEQSRVGIWTFGKYVNYLVQQKKVNAEWRSQAVDKVGSIRSVAASRNIGSVLRKASYDIKLKAKQPRVLLLISAGDVDIDGDEEKNNAERRKIVNGLLPQLREAGYVIHTIALSNRADSGLLATLAKETGGFAAVLSDHRDIYVTLQLLLQRLNPVNSVPVDGKQFAVDANLNRIAALLRHGKGQTVTMQTPSGREITQSSAANDPNVVWKQGKRFAWVQVDNPEMGQWQLPNQAGAEARIFVAGKPELNIVRAKDNYFAGQNLALGVNLAGIQELSNGSEPRVSIELSGRQTFSYELQPDSSAEGLYSGEVNGFYDPGLYRLRVTAEALDYTRILERPFQVYQLLQIDVGTQPGENGDDYLISVRAMDKDLDVEQSTLVATITDAEGEWRVSSVNLNESDYWELLLKDDGKSEEYQVKLDFKGTTFSGRKLHYQPKPLVIETPKVAVEKPAEIITPYHKPTQTKVAEPEPTVEKGKVAQEKSDKTERMDRSTLIIIFAAVSLLLGMALLIFYLKGSRKADAEAEEDVAEPQETEIEAESAEEQSEPEEALEEEPAEAEEPVTQTAEPDDKQEQEQSAEEDEDDLDVEINFDLDSKADADEQTDDEESEPAAEQVEPEPESATETESEAEVEVDIDPAEQSTGDEAPDVAEADDDVAEEEGTELAAEWSDMDAESNVEREQEDAGTQNVEIEFDFDDEDDDADDDRNKPPQ